MITNDKLIDLCSDWVNTNDCFYLAKENKIVHYYSPTGRAADYEWYRYTPRELVRMIAMSGLSSSEIPKLKEHHLITSLQENSRIYDFAVKSRLTVQPNIFNELDHMNKGDESLYVISKVIENLHDLDYFAVKASDLVSLIRSVFTTYRVKPISDTNNIAQTSPTIVKVAEELGYAYLAGDKRVYDKSKNKYTAFAMEGKRGRDIKDITQEDQDRINKRIGDLLSKK